MVILNYNQMKPIKVCIIYKVELLDEFVESASKSELSQKPEGMLKEILSLYESFEGNYNYVDKVCILLSKCLETKSSFFDELAKD